ncbi:MAG: hypothetical protein M1554_03355 [Patescibacteria group bacterium]|jgi:hypothetical protein|nr:hypothetical protein [Patescibacteria group bacterium]
MLMMEGLMNSVYTAVGGGYFLGLGLEELARRRVVKQREALLPTYKSVEKDKKQPFRHKLSKWVGPLALTGALLGGTLHYSFEGNTPRANNSPPLVQTVIDGSYNAGSTGSYNLEEQLISKLDLPNSSKVTIAINNTQNVINSNQLDKQVPYGANSVDQATENVLKFSFGNAPSAKTNLLRTINFKSGAEIVVNDQNALLSNSSALENLSKKDGNIPIYYVNVVPNGQRIINNKEGQDLALQTDGQYFNLTTSNIKQDTNSLNSILDKSNNNEKKPNNDLWFFRIGSAALMFMTYSIYESRKDETIYGIGK